ncbi:LOW QUALITY PROTEIN: integrator complex subunit 3 [Dermatophagoides pteronyssinus]|uniref:LOW QUALITY PROTEIN: integrator complex subunit 3 n=1 Tax=Dermatophagoides pteronyssinus TaxID=6956 RepID=UPI003F67C8A6
MSTSNYIGGGPPMPPLQSSQQQPDIVSSSLITSQQQQQQPATLDQNLERLFSFSIIETKDDYEEKMCRNYKFVQEQMQGRSEHQIHEELTRMSRESVTYSEEITLGLIVSMLVDNSNDNSHRLFLTIILSNRDGGNLLCNYINQITTERFTRLHEHARHRLLLLCKELLKSSIHNIETIFYNLMRNILPSDMTQRNLILAENILNILIEHRLCYDNNIPLMQYALVKYLRLIVDLMPSSRLLMKAVKYCHCLLTERFIDFIGIGRDLIRLLQQVCRISEFEQLWKTMLNNPSSLSPKFNLMQVLRTRTHRRFLRLLVTFEMERKLNYLISQVRFGSQRRYQEWFQRAYLNTPDNQMIRTDLIRFICNSIHPSNEEIAMGMVPRWAIIGWILNSCPQNLSLPWSRLALFYDWLLFDIQDSTNNMIMDLEPGVLVMYFSLKNHPGLTAALLDFLCRISGEFCPPLAAQIKMGIRNSFFHLLDKRVTTSLAFMFDPTKIELHLRQLITKTFPEIQNFSDLQQQQLMFQQPLPNQPQSSSLQGPGSAGINGHHYMAGSNQISTPGPIDHFPPQTLQQQMPTIMYSQQQQSQMPMVMGQASTSKFSDDEDESNNDSSDTNPKIASNNSAIGSKPPATKKMKKTNSFSGTTGVVSKPIIAAAKKIPSGAMALNKNNGSINSIGGQAISSSSPSSSSSSSSSTPTSTIISMNNSTEYIANILNSTVMSSSTSPSPSPISSSSGSTIVVPNQMSHNGPQQSQQLHIGQQMLGNPVSVIMSPSASSMNSSLMMAHHLQNPKIASPSAAETQMFSNSNNSNGNDSNIQIKPEVVTIIDESNSSDDVTLIDSSVYSSSISHHQSPYIEHQLDYNYPDSSAPLDERLSYSLSPQEMQEQINQIHLEPIKSILQRFYDARNRTDQCTQMEELVKKLTQSSSTVDEDEESPIADIIPNLTIILSAILDEDMSQKRFPDYYLHSYTNWYQPDQRALKASIDGPLFVMFAALVRCYREKEKPKNNCSDNADKDDDDNNESNSGGHNVIQLKQLLAEMATNNVRIGFLLLHYLVVTGNTFDQMAVYRDLVRCMSKDLSTALIADLETATWHDLYIFFYLIPAVMKSFPAIMVGNLDLIRMILEFGDYNSVQYLVILIQRDQLRLCKKDSLSVIISLANQFDHIQQHLLWDLLDAHDFSPDVYLNSLSKLDSNNEVLCGLNSHLVQIFKREMPTNQYLKQLMARDHHKLNDACFVISILLYWAKRWEDKLGEVIGTYVSSIISSPNKRNKRMLNNVSKSKMNTTANIEQLLFYLDEMRRTFASNKDVDFFNQDALIAMLVQLKQICTSQQKTKYADLFTNVPCDDNDNGNSNNGSQRKTNSSNSTTTGTKKTSNKKTSNQNTTANNSDTESDSSEEDVPQRTISKSMLRNKKRRLPVGFDSD